MNPVAETLTGWSSPEAIGQPLEVVFNIINETTRQVAENPVAKALRENRIVGLANHTILLTKTGHEIPIDDSASPIRNTKGGIIGVILVFRDVTARRRAERERETQAEILENRVKERTAQLEESVRSLEGVSYSIAHDLRGPLRSMEAFSTALLEDCSAELSPTAHNYASRIAASARRMDALIRELLAFGQLAHQEIPVERVSVDSTVNRVIASLEGVIKDYRAEITVGHLGCVVGNGTVLEQAILNLMTNALKFVKPGTPPRIEISSEKRGDRLRLLVKDHGVGIPNRYIDRIFKIFERLDPKNYPGTGIGLAIVQKSIQRMNGTVGVESSHDQGSTFWIELPFLP
jgi:PAS domain S-box-containing protein